MHCPNSQTVLFLFPHFFIHFLIYIHMRYCIFFLLYSNTRLLMFCSNNSKFIHWELFYFGFFDPLSSLILLFGNFSFLSDTTRCYRLIFFFFQLHFQNQSFLQRPQIFIFENKILKTQVFALCWLGATVFRTPQETELGNTCMNTNLCIHTFVYTHLYLYYL